jgi:hypothetical protein
LSPARVISEGWVEEVELLIDIGGKRDREALLLLEKAA